MAVKRIKRLKCPLCNDSFTKIEGLYDHIEDEHDDELPENYSPARYLYYLRTGKQSGSCVIDHKPTEWNDVTCKYNRFCDNPKCKERYKEEFRKRMLSKYGKVNLLKDPEQQKKMLAHRKISGTYTWSDGKKVTYTGSYEKEFLQFLDVFMNFDSSDIMAPSPHTYYYKYNGEELFYIPDFFIPSLNLEVEIKDGGDNANHHPKIQAVDKVKEKLKDEVMESQKDYDYIKIVNKNYDNFFEYLLAQKENVDINKDIRREKIVTESIINILEEGTFYNDIKCNNPKELYNWMHSNIRYDSNSNWKLKTAIEVYETKSGNCHDQAWFASKVLTKMHISNGLLFFIEYNNKESAGGRTHTLVWFKTGNDIYWFENSWGGRHGIHGPYKTVSELKKDIENIHSTEPQSKRYPLLQWGHPKKLHGGLSLGTYVEYALENYTDTEIITESYNTISFSKSFKDMKSIVDTLDENDLQYISDGDFTDSKYSIYREVLSYGRTPVSFIELYQFPKMKKNEAIIVLACRTEKKYEHMKNTHLLIWRMMSFANKNGITKVAWTFNNATDHTSKHNRKFEFYDVGSYKDISKLMEGFTDIPTMQSKYPKCVARCALMSKYADQGIDCRETCNNYKPEQECIENITDNMLNEGLLNFNKKLVYYISTDKNIQFTQSHVFGYTKKEALYWYLSHENKIKYKEVKDSEYADWFEKTTELIINSKFKKDLSETIYVFGANQHAFDNNKQYGTRIQNISKFQIVSAEETTLEELIKSIGLKLTISDASASEINTRKRIALELRKQFNLSINKSEFKKFKETKTLYLDFDSKEIDTFVNCDSDELTFIRYDLNRFYKNNARFYLRDDGGEEYFNLFKKFIDDICDNKYLDRLTFHSDGDWDDGSYSIHIHPDAVDSNERILESSINYIENMDIITESTTENKNIPVYVILFSNDTDFGKLIRKVTGSSYSHATVTTDPSLNDMYSFSDIPYNHDSMFGAGFVRESLWSPMYRKNKFFTILVTFTDAEGIKNYNNKLKKFKDNYINYKYNDIGLVQYYLNFKNTTDTRKERKKMRWFCSEFVTLMLNAAGVDGFEDVLQSPGDLRNNQELIEIGDFTLNNFNENTLRTKTKAAYKEFQAREASSIKEDFTEIVEEVLNINYTEDELNLLIEAKIKDGVRNEKEVTPYTALLDWKYLYDQFISLFPKTDPSVRFDLFEIIIRDYIVPLRLSVETTTDTIIKELKRIKQSVVNVFGKIVGVNVPEQTITTSKSNGETVDIKYPDLIKK